MSLMSIQDADVLDIQPILKIYGHYINHSTLTMETQLPSRSELASKISEIQTSHAFLCLLLDGDVIGFAYAYPFSPREAYRHSANLILYLHPEFDELNFRNLLYQALEERLTTKGIRNLLVTLPTSAEKELEFYSNEGFEKRGNFPKAARKFDQWWDLVWMSKIIG